MLHAEQKYKRRMMCCCIINCDELFCDTCCIWQLNLAFCSVLSTRLLRTYFAHYVTFCYVLQFQCVNIQKQFVPMKQDILRTEKYYLVTFVSPVKFRSIFIAAWITNHGFLRMYPACMAVARIANNPAQSSFFWHRWQRPNPPGAP